MVATAVVLAGPVPMVGVALRQVGIVRHLAGRPVSGFCADRVTTSSVDHPLGMSESLPCIAGSVIDLLAATVISDAVRRHGWPGIGIVGQRVAFSTLRCGWWSGCKRAGWVLLGR